MSRTHMGSGATALGSVRTWDTEEHGRFTEKFHQPGRTHLKLSRTTSVIVITVVFSSLFLINLAHATPQHGFSVSQYEQFHDVLHPLEHEALPNKDFRRIRNKAPELIR